MCNEIKLKPQTNVSKICILTVYYKQRNVARCCVQSTDPALEHLLKFY